MQISIIIPTYNRVNDLEEVLGSILEQTELPKEVIIVDDSDRDETKNLITQIENAFKRKNITLEYIRNKRGKSLTIARNTGIEYSKSGIVLFLDDDVILGSNYIKEILRVYKERPDALGVQGYELNKASISKTANIIGKILFGWHIEKNKCRVLPSGSPTYPYLPDKIISCQWLSGTNQSYKREVLQDFKYDENLKRYSYCEDIDLSYRVYKTHPNSLYMTPYAKLMHKCSQTGRLPKKHLVYMHKIYTFYLVYKDIDQTLKNKLILLWNTAGFLIVGLIGLILKPTKIRLLNVKYTFDAYILCIKHLKEIKKGDLEFFNKTL